MESLFTAGQRHESAFFTDVVDQVRVPRPIGQPKKRLAAVAEDRAYRVCDSKENRKWCSLRNIESVIPAQNRIHTGPGRPPACYKQEYKQRNVVERPVGYLKERRRIGTLYGKKASHCKAMLQWAFIGEYLKQ